TRRRLIPQRGQGHRRCAQRGAGDGAGTDRRTRTRRRTRIVCRDIPSADRPGTPGCGRDDPPHRHRCTVRRHGTLRGPAMKYYVILDHEVKAGPFDSHQDADDFAIEQSVGHFDIVRHGHDDKPRIMLSKLIDAAGTAHVDSSRLVIEHQDLTSVLDDSPVSIGDIIDAYGARRKAEGSDDSELYRSIAITSINTVAADHFGSAANESIREGELDMPEG